MMNIMKEAEENRKKMRLVFANGLTATVAFVTLCGIVSVYSEAMSTAAKIIIIAIAICIFAVGIGITMEGERTIGSFRCKNCGELFQPTWAAYVMGMHIWTTRYLKCPSCGKSTWCKKVYSKDE